MVIVYQFRLDFKQAWDIDFRAYLKKLDAQKPLILCGDLNVAHQEIGEHLVVALTMQQGGKLVKTVSAPDF